ncbi:MAG TPA: hypothetical protein V6C81_13935 [Planktothrix sp.]|jgi:hypothetical protein
MTYENSTEQHSQPQANHNNASGIHSAVHECWGRSASTKCSSSQYDKGDRAIDTQREVKKANGNTSLVVGIALDKHMPSARSIDTVASFKSLPFDKQAKVLASGAGAFGRVMGDQSEQIAHGVCDGTQDFVVGTVETGGKIVQAAWDTAEFWVDLQTDPIKAGGEVIDKTEDAVLAANHLNVLAHQGCNAASKYYLGAASGKVHPLDDASVQALKCGQAISHAYEKWDAQPPYDKARQGTAVLWGFSTPQMLEGIAALKAAGTPEAEAALSAIQNRVEKVGSILAKCEKEETGEFLRAGKGGDWPVLNERQSPDVVQQIELNGCTAAVGEMLSEGRLSQVHLYEKAEDIPEWMTPHLGREWKCHSFVKKEPRLNMLLDQGRAWSAELKEPFSREVEPGHMVVVDGLDEAGNLMIRDPKQATRYEMTRADFLEAWTSRSIYR